MPVHDEEEEALGVPAGDPELFLLQLQQYISPEGPWRCPLMRAICKPNEALVYVDEDGDVLVRLRVGACFMLPLFIEPLSLLINVGFVFPFFGLGWYCLRKVVCSKVLVSLASEESVFLSFWLALPQKVAFF